ncbi:hypothetical protein ABTZ58_23585 [Streptomyces sp. NPDC094143]|uniref:hypothetical protein n=1 Tax=Streptomyces sp. NPDC094143 TaxID=3155310 RepID=UPI003331B7B7
MPHSTDAADLVPAALTWCSSAPIGANAPAVRRQGKVAMNRLLVEEVPLRGKRRCRVRSHGRNKAA